MSSFQFTAAHALCQYSGEACSCQTLYERQLVNTLNTAANWSTEAEVFQDGAERVLGVFSRLQKPTFYYRTIYGKRYGFSLQQLIQMKRMDFRVSPLPRPMALRRLHKKTRGHNTKARRLLDGQVYLSKKREIRRANYDLTKEERKATRLRRKAEQAESDRLRLQKIKEEEESESALRKRLRYSPYYK